MRVFFVLAAMLCVGTSAAQRAPDWTLTSAKGVEIRSADVWKRGPSLLLFWATWCPYCKALMPHLQSMLEEYRSDDCRLSVYAFSYREDGDPEAVVAERGYTFELFTEPGDLPERMEVVGTPGLFVVDTSGEILLDVYDVSATMRKDPAVEKLKHWQKAARRAPYWAARIREAIDRSCAQR